MPPSSNKSLRIGSWNVRTMYEVGKQEQIRNEMHRYNLDILGISETHWSQSGQRKFKTGELIEAGVTHILNVTCKAYTKREKYFKYLDL